VSEEGGEEMRAGEKREWTREKRKGREEGEEVRKERRRTLGMWVFFSVG